MKFEALFANEGSGAGTVRFEIKDERGEHVGHYLLDVAPTGLGTTDGMLGHAHRQMAEVVRKWADDLLTTATVFEGRSG